MKTLIIYFILVSTACAGTYGGMDFSMLSGKNQIAQELIHIDMATEKAFQKISGISLYLSIIGIPQEKINEKMKPITKLLFEIEKLSGDLGGDINSIFIKDHIRENGVSAREVAESIKDVDKAAKILHSMQIVFTKVRFEARGLRRSVQWGLLDFAKEGKQEDYEEVVKLFKELDEILKDKALVGSVVHGSSTPVRR